MRRLALDAIVALAVWLLHSAAGFALSPEAVPHDTILADLLRPTAAELEAERIGEEIRRQCLESGYASPACQNILDDEVDAFINTQPCEWTRLAVRLVAAANAAVRSAGPDGANWLVPTFQRWQERLSKALPYLPPRLWPEVLGKLPRSLWDADLALRAGWRVQVAAIALAKRLRAALLAAPDLDTPPATAGLCATG